MFPLPFNHRLHRTTIAAQRGLIHLITRKVHNTRRWETCYPNTGENATSPSYIQLHIYFQDSLALWSLSANKYVDPPIIYPINKWRLPPPPTICSWHLTFIYRSSTSDVATINSGVVHGLLLKGRTGRWMSTYDLEFASAKQEEEEGGDLFMSSTTYFFVATYSK